MPERITIQFQGPDGKLSCILYSRRGHPALLEMAQGYAAGLTARVEALHPNRPISFPMDRYEVDVVILRFLRKVMEYRLPAVRIDRLLPPDQTTISEGNHHIIPLPYRQEQGP